MSDYKKPVRKFHNTTPKSELKDVIFGLQPVIEAIKAGKEIEKIIVQREMGNIELLEFARIKNIPTQKVPKEKLDRITRKNHQGVIAYVSAINYVNMEDIVASVYEKGEQPLVLVLDRITDVRNFGGIARTAEVAGVHLIVIPNKGAAQINSDAMKTSAGALNFIPVARVDQLKDAVVYLQSSGLQAIGCTEKAKSPMYLNNFNTPTAIIMGSEEDGIQPELQEILDGFATIPQAGRVQSLNVGVACGVLLYEVIRQRQTIA